MYNRLATIEVLRLQLQELEIATINVRNAYEQLESELQPSPNSSRPNVIPTDPLVDIDPTLPEDKDGNAIHIGATVQFLTRGKFKSKSGVVVRFSRNCERVFSRDSERNEIARAPYNLRVTG